MFEKLGRLLPSSIRKSPSISRGVEAATVVEMAQKTVDTLFGDDAPHMRPATYKNGTLKITCDRSVYAETLRLREQEVIDGVNGRIGQNLVKKVVTR
jgi:predicted nucleic acid-binding Zn ribbon protein